MALQYSPVKTNTKDEIWKIKVVLDTLIENLPRGIWIQFNNNLVDKFKRINLEKSKIQLTYYHDGESELINEK